MSWLKRQQPIRLYQGSDIPYVILADGVHLCFDNCYGIAPDLSEHNICLEIEANLLKRVNTHFYKISNFPAIIPFSDVIFLDDIITEGRITKTSGTVMGESQSVAIVKPNYIKQIASNFEEFNDTLDEYDVSFILVEEDIDSQTRCFTDTSNIIIHYDWPRTLVSVIDILCPKKKRAYCWTQTLPELSISCYGIHDTDEIIEINETLSIIGINDVSVTWVD